MTKIKNYGEAENIYVALEGIDGAYKTTIAKKLHEEIEGSLLVKEPHTVYIKNAIEVIKQIEPKYEESILSCLFAADRLVLLEKIQRHRGMVISDRSKFSSFAYQEYLGYNYEVNMCMKNPDVIIYLDISPEIAEERYEGYDKFEDKQFLEIVRRNYQTEIMRIAIDERIKWFEVDASRDFDVVYNEVKNIIDKEVNYGRTNAN